MTSITSSGKNRPLTRVSYGAPREYYRESLTTVCPLSKDPTTRAKWRDLGDRRDCRPRLNAKPTAFLRKGLGRLSLVASLSFAYLPARSLLLAYSIVLVLDRFFGPVPLFAARLLNGPGYIQLSSASGQEETSPEVKQAARWKIRRVSRRRGMEG